MEALTVEREPVITIFLPTIELREVVDLLRKIERNAVWGV